MIEKPRAENNTECMMPIPPQQCDNMTRPGFSVTQLSQSNDSRAEPSESMISNAKRHLSSGEGTIESYFLSNQAIESFPPLIVDFRTLESMEEFPLVPLYFIPRMTKDALDYCEECLVELQASVDQSMPEKELLMYIERQLSSIKSEKDRRSAHERVQAMVLSNSYLALSSLSLKHPPNKSPQVDHRVTTHDRLEETRSITTTKRYVKLNRIGNRREMNVFCANQSDTGSNLKVRNSEDTLKIKNDNYPVKTVQGIKSSCRFGDVPSIVAKHWNVRKDGKEECEKQFVIASSGNKRRYNKLAKKKEKSSTKNEDESRRIRDKKKRREDAIRRLQDRKEAQSKRKEAERLRRLKLTYNGRNIRHASSKDEINDMENADSESNSDVDSSDDGDRGSSIYSFVDDISETQDILDYEVNAINHENRMPDFIEDKKILQVPNNKDSKITNSQSSEKEATCSLSNNIHTHSIEAEEKPTREDNMELPSACMTNKYKEAESDAHLSAEGLGELSQASMDINLGCYKDEISNPESQQQSHIDQEAESDTKTIISEAINMDDNMSRVNQIIFFRNSNDIPCSSNLFLMDKTYEDKKEDIDRKVIYVEEKNGSGKEAYIVPLDSRRPEQTCILLEENSIKKPIANSVVRIPANSFKQVVEAPTKVYSDAVDIDEVIDEESNHPTQCKDSNVTNFQNSSFNEMAKATKKLSFLDIQDVNPDTYDYSQIYPSFHAILSVFYENSPHRKKSTSMKRVQELRQSEEVALRFQMKLYTIWSSIMSDYQALFTSSPILLNSIQNRSADDGSSDYSPHTRYFRINSSTRPEVYQIVYDTFQNIENWNELPSGLGLKTTWNFLWTWSKPKVQRSSLLCWQKINHFPGARALTRKDLLKRHLHAYRKINQKMFHSYDIIPETFNLPAEYVQFVSSFTRNQDSVGSSSNIWIMKPVGLSRGRGISLFNDLSEVCYGEAVVVQKYLSNPLLLDGYKFDLRIYVLVTSFNPLEAFVYDEGFVRICTTRYSTHTDDIDNLYIHLTNSSIQRHNPKDNLNMDNPLNTADHHEKGGTKMSFTYLWKRLSERGVDVEKLKQHIDLVILKSLVCANDHISYQVNSFEVFGYDILIDNDLKPWLIEVNSSPSMGRDSRLDHEIKDALMKDTIHLIDPPSFDREKLLQVLKRRLHETEYERKHPHSNKLTPVHADILQKRQLNTDLHEILRGYVPRSYGEIPKRLGNYRVLCPNTEIHNLVMRLRKQNVPKNIKGSLGSK